MTALSLLRAVVDRPRRWSRGLYDWTLQWAETPQSLAALFLIALAESSIFPVPPDLLLIPIVAARPLVWLRAAGLCTAGSVIGAAIGYGIGAVFMATLGSAIIELYRAQEHWARFLELAARYGIWFLAAAAFTPIPFKVATIASGAAHMPFAGFLIVSMVGRAGRFFLVAGVLRIFGAPVRHTLERHFDLATVAFLVLLIGGFLVIRLL